MSDLTSTRIGQTFLSATPRELKRIADQLERLNQNLELGLTNDSGLLEEMQADARQRRKRDER